MSQLFVETRGQGKNLVLIHGWGLNSGVWESISPELEQHYRLTMIDLPGFGRNAETLPAVYDLLTISSMVKDCLPDKCSILGWSLGGLVAQQLAIELGNRIEKLVLTATSPKFNQFEHWVGIKPNVLSIFEQQLERDFSKTLDRFMAIQALGSASAKQDIKRIKAHVENYPIPANEALRAGLNILADTDLREQIAQIKAPTLRMYGRLDSLVPIAAVPMIAKLQPNAQSYTFAHASHAPFVSHPAEFIKQTREFLD